MSQVAGQLRANALVASDYRTACQRAGLPVDTPITDFVAHHRAQAKQEITLELELAKRQPLHYRPAPHVVDVGAEFIDLEGRRFVSDGTVWTLVEGV